jgi:superfamily II DNA helicase RecQ
MVGYADAAGCLRAAILRYFGDPAAHEPCGACGNCDRRAPARPARERVGRTGSAVAEIQTETHAHARDHITAPAV